MRSLREYGWKERYISATAGTNSRLDELQAAILRVKLRRLDADNARRQALAARYAAALRQVAVPRVSEGCDHVWHQYVVRVSRRDAFREHLQAAGIATAIHYPLP